MRQYAEQYVSNLPNFLCVQVTEQYEAGAKPKHWRKGDTLTSRLVFNEGREQRTLQLVNNKPPKGAIRPWRIPLTTEGEFGMLLDRVLGSESGATFAWSGWETVDGRRVAVFHYAIDKDRSTLQLSLSDLDHAIIPYSGAIYGDPDTGVVWRITSTASDIPEELETRSISTVISYGGVPIGGANYLLPVEASVLVDTGSRFLRNEIHFTNYQKFETSSNITYNPTPLLH